MIKIIHLGLTPKEAETIAALIEQEADDLEHGERNAPWMKARVRHLRSIAAKMREGLGE